MKERQLAFGYTIQQGQIVACEREGAVVQRIFKAYIEGISYLQIATALSQEKNLTYHEGKQEWNKHMVKRILENSRYLGTDRHPAIISEETFYKAGQVREGKKCAGTGYAPAHTIRKSAICSMCGGSLKRHINNYGKERWYCKNKECAFSTRITDTLLMEQVISLLSLAIENPQIIEIPSNEIRCHDLEIIRMTNEINRQLDKPDCNEEYAKTLIIARAAAQYAICSHGLPPQEVWKIQSLFESSEPSAQLNIELFKNTVDTVIVQPDGEVSLKLKNGQKLGNVHERRAMTC